MHKEAGTMGALTINTNTSAINTQRNLLDVDKRLKTNLEHLSSGMRIVRQSMPRTAGNKRDSRIGAPL